MTKTEIKVLWVVWLVVNIFIALFWYDSTNLTTYSYQALLTDKWHEESCSPILDANGGYIGENCSDTYTVVLVVEGKRFEQTISNQDFQELPIGSNVNYSFSKGRLGIQHNLRIEAKG